MSLILPRDIERIAADDTQEAVLLEGLEGEGEEWDPESVRSACRVFLAAARKDSRP